MAAPKGNKYAQGHGFGRPRKYEKLEEFEIEVEKYFDSIKITSPLTENIIDGYEDAEKKKPIFIKVPVVNDAGEQVYTKKYVEIPTITGLCVFLGITRETLMNYEKREDFFGTIKIAKLIIENYAENELFKDKGHVGVIFNLKNNFGWKDKQEISHEGEMSVAIIDDIK